MLVSGTSYIMSHRLTYSHSFRFTPLILSYFFLTIRKAHETDIEGSTCADDEAYESSDVVFAPMSENATARCGSNSDDELCGRHRWDMEYEGNRV